MTHFPPYKFDPHDLTLWRGASEVPLTPKAAALLGCLLAARGARVSKNEILSAVWPDTHVQPENIKVLVREIRHALGDSPTTTVIDIETQQFISINHKKKEAQEEGEAGPQNPASPPLATLPRRENRLIKPGLWERRR